MKNTHVVVCIFGANQYQYYSHCQMRTLPLFHELKKHFSYCYFNPSESIIPKFQYKKFFIIQVKLGPIPHQFLKIKNKFIIWDIIDILQDTRESTLWKNQRFLTGYNMSNVLNCPNSKMQKVIENNNSEKKIITMIPHNWDSRIAKHYSKAKENKKLKTLKVGYLGTPNTKEEAYCVKTSPYIVNLGRTIEEKDIGTFNACCSLRNADIAFGKPGTKSFVAASLNSIIIASKEEYNIVDLFGENYPYYLVKQGNTIGERLQKTVDYVVSTYKKEEWEKAMEIASSVRERTSIQNIALQFKKLILNNV